MEKRDCSHDLAPSRSLRRSGVGLTSGSAESGLTMKLVTSSSLIGVRSGRMLLVVPPGRRAEAPLHAFAVSPSDACSIA